GFKVFSSNQPLRTLDDYRGQRMRIQSSRVLDASMRAVGALPQVLAFSDTYQALKQGTVDGTENPPSNLYTQRMHEVQRHLALSYHGYLGYAVVINTRFWEGLPSDIRAQLSQAIAESTEVANKVALRDNQEALNQVRAAGLMSVYTPTRAERLAMKKAMVVVHQQMATRIGDDTIREIYEATDFKLGGL